MIPLQIVPYGHCQCGCGRKTSVAVKNQTVRGFRKGQPFRHAAPGHYKGKCPDEGIHKQRAVRYTRAWQTRNLEQYREAQRRDRLWRKFGLKPEDYDAMLEAQKGVCAICGREETATWRGKTRELCVDHCHTTGRVRGLLCNRCNHSIGGLGDNAEGVRRALAYLEAA